ncbi:MAG: hypothetical protein H6806_10580 [Planctomycetes bacterium]|nr:hypothetical protein [Planctomycetota bacterium]MCB9901881.1 hypothetical protein [Planctomycetota bacterium]
MASPLTSQLRRLGRGMALRRGSRRQRVVHLVVLVVACVLAFTSRALRPLPILSQLEGRLLPTLAVAAGLLLLAWPLRLLGWGSGRRDLTDLARRLDDRLELKDQASTALEVDPPRTGLDRTLATQAAGLLAHAVPPGAVGRGPDRLRWPRRLLAFLFAFLLLAPGVDGLFGERGIGRGDVTGLAAPDGDPTTGRGRIDTRVWLSWFAVDPLPVEALPPDADADGVPR